MIRLDDIPFPPRDNPLCLPPAGADQGQQKQAYRHASLRYHPDKFFARYGSAFCHRRPLHNLDQCHSAYAAAPPHKLTNDGTHICGNSTVIVAHNLRV